MNQNKMSLLKIFSVILREKAKSETEFRSISPEMVKHFSRKELIEIITKIYDGKVPQEYNLMEMENDELLKLISDDMHIISYVTQKWSKEVATLPPEPIKNSTPPVASVSTSVTKNLADKDKEKLK